MMKPWKLLWIDDNKKTIEKRNVIWNIIGSFLYAFSSLFLTIGVVQILGEEAGGIFTFAFTALGQQMFTVAYFGIRPFHITDVEHQYTFGEYLHLRIVTSIFALVLAGCYLLLQTDNTGKEIQVMALMVIYKVIDGFADVYEAEFQRSGRLYLTGKSNVFRTLLSVGSFFGVLIITKDIISASIMAVAAQVIGVVFFNVLVIRKLPNVNWNWHFNKTILLLKSCMLLFFSVFLDFYIFSASKYAVEQKLGNAEMAVYGAIFMPTSFINLAAGFVIRPFLTKLSYLYEEKRNKEFNQMIIKLSGMILILTITAVLGAGIIGIPVLTLLYPNLASALSTSRAALVLIVLGGGFYGWMNLFYYALVILKCQKQIFFGYIFICALALISSTYAVERFGLLGGAISYLGLMMVTTICFGGSMAVVLKKRGRGCDGKNK